MKGIENKKSDTFVSDVFYVFGGLDRTRTDMYASTLDFESSLYTNFNTRPCARIILN